MKQMHAISCIDVRDRKLHPVIGRRVVMAGSVHRAPTSNWNF